MTKNCLYCNAIMYQDNEGLVCYRCKPHNLGVKPEIYATEQSDEKQDRFSDVYCGNINYRKMRQKNIDLHPDIDGVLN